MNTRIISSTLLVLAVLARAVHAAPLATAFTYQGHLQQNGTPTSDTCDFQFKLFDAPGSGSPPAGGNKLGSDQAVTNVIVTNGVFTVLLNDAGQFGPTAFAGEDRWLQIGVTCPATGSHTFTAIGPRQPLTATPYALYAPTAGSASNVSCTGCIGAADLADGAVTIAKIASGVGDVTAVTAGPGLIGGGGSGDVQLSANFGGSGGASTVSRSDHDHGAQTWKTSFSVGLKVESTLADGFGLIGIGPGIGVSGQTQTGTGVSGSSEIGVGVEGNSQGTGNGAAGVSGMVSGSPALLASGVRGRVVDAGSNGRGVSGSHTGNGIGVFGSSVGGEGVFGSGQSGDAIYGTTTSGAGVRAFSDTGVGVVANSSSGNLIEAYKGGRPNVRKFYVANNGDVLAAGTFHPSGADIAEGVPSRDHLEPGEVVEIDPIHPGELRRATTANSTAVAGVISTRPGVALRETEATDAPDDAPQLALVGRVPVKVSAEHGAIRPGDLLVAAAMPGRAMRAPENPAVGSIVGKALGELKSGSGTIQMLVMLR